MKYYLKLLSIPLLFLFLLISLSLVWKIFNLPPTEVLAETVKNWYELYGLPILFLSSVVEGGLLVGNYFPGAFIIFIGVILSDSILEAIVVVTVVTVGLFLVHLFNYALGKYGWYKVLVRFGMKGAIDNAQERLTTKGPVAIFSSYWMPSVGALTDTAAGIIQMPFKIFFTWSLVSSIFWGIFFGAVVYIMGDAAISIADPGATGVSLIATIIIIWMIILVAIDFRKRKLSTDKY